MNNNSTKYLVFSGMGMELVGLILGAYYMGNYLDDKYHGNGLYFVGLSLAVLVGWLIQTIFLLSRFAKEDEKEEQNEKPS